MHIMYHKKIRQALSCILTLLLLAGILLRLTDLTERKASDLKYADFFNEEEDFDVLFLGTSHVINGIFPMELWNDYGIVSYNFGGHGNAIATSYWVMEMALDYASPSLIVIDCLGLSSMTKTSTKYSNVHLSFDTFPLNMTKIKAVTDLLNDSEMQKRIEDGSVTETEQRTPLSLLWNFSVYHNRWSELQENDFSPDKNIEKGAESRIAVAAPNPILQTDKTDRLEEDTVGVQYLEKMITDCQDRGIDVLLLYLPFPATEAQHRDANRVYDIAETYGVPYLNFLDMNLVDYATDCYDSNSHLNPSGARKVTDFLGSYIKEHYHIPDRRTDIAYDAWNGDYESYKQSKVRKLKAQTQLDRYLMLLSDKNYDVTVEIHDSRIFRSEYYCNLFKNLGVDMEKAEPDVDFLAIQSRGEQVSCIKGLFTQKMPADTCMGSFSADRQKDGNYSIFRDQEAFYTVSKDGQNADIRIAVVDKQTEKVIDVAWFDIIFDSEHAEPVVSAVGSHE